MGAPLIHASFALERRYAASASTIFAAFADPALKACWFARDVRPEVRWHEFRIGGHECYRGMSPRGEPYGYDGTYQDIVADRRIVFTYGMSVAGRCLSLSLATVDIAPEGPQSRLVYAEQGMFLDGLDNPRCRQRGTVELLSRLAQVVAADIT